MSVSAYPWQPIRLATDSKTFAVNRVQVPYKLYLTGIRPIKTAYLFVLNGAWNRTPSLTRATTSHSVCVFMGAGEQSGPGPNVNPPASSDATVVTSGPFQASGNWAAGYLSRQAVGPPPERIGSFSGAPTLNCADFVCGRKRLKGARFYLPPPPVLS